MSDDTLIEKMWRALSDKKRQLYKDNELDKATLAFVLSYKGRQDIHQDPEFMKIHSHGIKQPETLFGYPYSIVPEQEELFRIIER